MSDRLHVKVVFAALACSALSCQGTADGLSSVGGKVLCNGVPATGAVLLFHRETGGAPPPSGSPAVIPTAVVQEDGSFTVESASLGYGASPGSYVVLAQWPQDGDLTEAAATDRKKATATIRGKKVVVRKHTKLNSLAPDRLKGRYMDASRPLLKTEVKPGSNNLGTLELSLNN